MVRSSKVPAQLSGYGNKILRLLSIIAKEQFGIRIQDSFRKGEQLFGTQINPKTF